MTVLTDTQVVTASGGLVELGVGTATSNVVVNTTYPTVTTIIPNVTVVTDGSPIELKFDAPFAYPGAASGTLTIGLYRDGTELVRGWSVTQTTSTQGIPVSCSFRDTPTAGSHTYSVRGYYSSSTWTLYAGTNITYPPITLRISKIVTATQWPAVTTGTIICTSSTRPASPFAGQQIYETDTLLPYTYNGTIWTSSLPAFLSAAGTDTTVGPPSGNLIYTFATVTLTPGTWLVTAGMSLINTVTSDDAAVGLYNRTTSAEVASSRGAAGSTQTAFEHSLVSRQVSMTVTANTQVCPYGTRNGGSTIRPVNTSGGTPGYIQATRISIP